jgi:hypothetical protein
LCVTTIVDQFIFRLRTVVTPERSRDEGATSSILFYADVWHLF